VYHLTGPSPQPGGPVLIIMVIFKLHFGGIDFDHTSVVKNPQISRVMFEICADRYIVLIISFIVRV
jgi:hypothetical protein